MGCAPAKGCARTGSRSCAPADAIALWSEHGASGPSGADAARAAGPRRETHPRGATVGCRGRIGADGDPVPTRRVRRAFVIRSPTIGPNRPGTRLRARPQWAPRPRDRIMGAHLPWHPTDRRPWPDLASPCRQHPGSTGGCGSGRRGPGGRLTAAVLRGCGCRCVRACGGRRAVRRRRSRRCVRSSAQQRRRRGQVVRGSRGGGARGVVGAGAPRNGGGSVEDTAAPRPPSAPPRRADTRPPPDHPHRAPCLPPRPQGPGSRPRGQRKPLGDGA